MAPPPPPRDPAAGGGPPPGAVDLFPGAAVGSPPPRPDLLSINLRRDTSSSTRSRRWPPHLRPLVPLPLPFRHRIWSWRRPLVAEAPSGGGGARSGRGRAFISKIRCGPASGREIRRGGPPSRRPCFLPCVGAGVGGGTRTQRRPLLLQDPATLLQDPAADRGGGGGPTLSLSHLPMCGDAWR
jgi:hypothetical protein